MSDDEATPMTEDPTPPASAAAPTKPVYDQEFFLALARPSANTDEARAEARERWNAWRRDPANERVVVTFVGVDFRTEENRGISFAGFEFGYGTQFYDAKFDDSTRFYGANFGPLAIFIDATFEFRATFRDAIFRGSALFNRVAFGHRADFCGTKISDQAIFADATFGHQANFGDATFGTGADFSCVTFGSGTTFDGATFGGNADFSGKPIDEVVVAREQKLSDLTDEERAHRMLDFRERLQDYHSDSSKFLAVSFAVARFCGSVSFARRSFERPADFTGVRFEAPPAFDGASNLHRIDFTGARAGFVPADRPWWKPDWTTDSAVAIRLRALRSHIEATKNHDFERDLYIEERKAERGIYFARYRREKRWGALAGHCVWIAVMGAYWALSDYGRSWLRPTAWLVASIPAFHFLYAGLLSDRREGAVVAAREAVTGASADKDALTVVKGWEAAEARVLSDYDATVGQLAVSNAVPFVGPLTIDPGAKAFLYCGVWPAGKGEAGAGTVVEPCRPIPPPGFQIATISQNLLSILLVFFIGLALRNYFRLK